MWTQECYIVVEKSGNYDPLEISNFAVKVITQYVNQVFPISLEKSASAECLYRIGVTESSGRLSVTINGNDFDTAGETTQTGINGVQQAFLRAVYQKRTDQKENICQRYISLLLEDCGEEVVQEDQEAVADNQTVVEKKDFFKDFKIMKAGKFMMGSDSGDIDEKPASLVHIKSNFYISDHEVTVKEYEEFVKETKYPEPKGCADKFDNWGKEGRENHPINCVSWEDANAYIQWLNKVDPNHNYRLCKEAEWEYAARAGTKEKWACGRKASCLYEHAWFYRNTKNKGTRPVKTQRPNQWGLYDMQGNVWEWVQDRKCPYTKKLNKNAERECNEDYRVYRGGGFDGDINSLRSAYRFGFYPGYRFVIVGFRVCSSK